MIRVLGCWYSTAQIHPQLLRSSLQSIDEACRASTFAEPKVRTCTWEPIPGNPFHEDLSHYCQPSHLGIASQIARVVFEEQQAGRDYDVVCFLEHDVLYPHDYFDQIARLFATAAGIRGVRNQNYIGMNDTGWLGVVSRHEPPLHQLSLSWNTALDHIDALLRRCILYGSIQLEPAEAADIVAYHLETAGPACHMNHSQHFTNHYDCYESDSGGTIVDEYWGDYRQYYPMDDTLGAASLSEDVKSGVVIGHFNRVQTLELNLRAIRAHCGPVVPVLISDDCSPGFGVSPEPDSAFDRVLALTKKFPNVFVWPNVERIGHTGGDMSAFWKAIVWGHHLKLDVVFKLSQRYIIDRPNWSHDSAKDLLQSGASTLGRRCTESDFPLRTEAVGLNLHQWYRPDILAHLAPRRVAWPTERIIWDDVADRLDGRLHPWSLVTEARRETHPEALFHTANEPEDYRRLAARLGMNPQQPAFEADQQDYLIG